MLSHTPAKKKIHFLPLISNISSIIIYKELTFLLRSDAEGLQPPSPQYKQEQYGNAGGIYGTIKDYSTDSHHERPC